jgi:hypothetical protein
MTTQNLPQNTTARNGYHAGQITQILTTFDDLNQHGDYTAAALAIGDIWLLLSANWRAYVVRSLKAGCKSLEAPQAAGHWAAFDDLHAHGDYTAAALVVGDIWLMLPENTRTLVTGAVKLATFGGAR